MHHSFTDASYDYINGWGTTYSQIESCLAIITACIPALRPLFAVLMPGLFLPTTTSSELGAGSEAGRWFATTTIGGTQVMSGYRSGQRHKHAGVRVSDDDGDAFQLQRVGCTQLRGHSPSGSEQEIIRHGGIVRTTRVCMFPAGISRLVCLLKC